MGGLGDSVTPSSSPDSRNGVGGGIVDRGHRVPTARTEVPSIVNADAFRHLYGYHFAENRTLWDEYVSRLDDVAFTADATYSHGSVREQVLHLAAVDDAWFGQLAGGQEAPPEPGQDAGREEIRAYADGVERRVRAWLADLRDDMLLERPWTEGEDKDLVLWQVLVHVVNHGTDHRAQLLRQLNDLGVATVSQDYVFYAYDNPIGGADGGAPAG